MKPTIRCPPTALRPQVQSLCPVAAGTVGASRPSLASNYFSIADAVVRVYFSYGVFSMYNTYAGLPPPSPSGGARDLLRSSLRRPLRAPALAWGACIVPSSFWGPLPQNCHVVTQPRAARGR